MLIKTKKAPLYSPFSSKLLRLTALVVGVFFPRTALAQYQCGGGDQAVTVSIDLGCERQGNAIIDAMGGLIGFMATGIGLIITLMIVIGGIQYVASSGNPQRIEAAKKKILHAVEALLLFIFMAAILNFVIPGGIIR